MNLSAVLYACSFLMTLFKEDTAADPALTAADAVIDHDASAVDGEKRSTSDTAFLIHTVFAALSSVDKNSVVASKKAHNGS